MIGKTISHYKILENLGGGSKSIVYKAQDLLLERIVALKVLSEKWHSKPTARVRFLRGAQAIAQLDHPNICTVYDVDSAEEQVFIVMAYIEGSSLTQRIEAGALNVAETCDIALQAAEGLNSAHSNGIIHRDVKDGNFMINKDGAVKIVDFGLAKLLPKEDITRPRAVLGTAPYISPEQAVGDRVDHRTDIWSLGVVMHRMLTRKYPFKGQNMAEMLKSIVNDEPRNLREIRPDIPESLDSCINKMLRKDRRHRHDDMGEVIADLKRVTSN